MWKTYFEPKAYTRSYIELADLGLKNQQISYESLTRGADSFACVRLR